MSQVDTNQIDINKYTENIDVLIIYSIGVIGLILYHFFSENSNNYSVIIGNSMIIISSIILLYMILRVDKFSLADNVGNEGQEQKKILEFKLEIQQILQHGLPILLLVIALVYITILNITYSINKADFTKFVIYNTISSYVVIVQILLIYKLSWDIVINGDNQINNSLGWLFSIILGIINLLIVLIIHIILESHLINDK